MRPLNSIKIGAKFLIKKYYLEKFDKHQLLELGIIPENQIEIIQKNFSFVIIKCQGVKFALANSVAQQLIGNEI